MRIVPHICVIVSAFAGIGVFGSAASSLDESFILGVADGRMILPVGKYNGYAWELVWPEGEESDRPVPALDAVPDDWLGGPIPRQWTLWSASGLATPQSTTGLVRPQNTGCVAQPRILVGEIPEDGRRYELGHSELRIAASGAIRYRSIERVTSADREARELSAAIRAAVSEYERPRIELELKAQPNWTMLRRLLTDRTPPRIEVYRGPDDRERHYYFEAVRALRDQPRHDGAAVTTLGWMIRDHGFQVVSATAVIGEPERPYGDPIGAVLLDDSEVWLMDASPGEGRFFELVEIAASGVRLLFQSRGEGC